MLIISIAFILCILCFIAAWFLIDEHEIMAMFLVVFGVIFFSVDMVMMTAVITAAT